MMPITSTSGIANSNGGDNTADMVKPPAAAATNHSAIPHST
jgi:hypothetical protein